MTDTTERKGRRALNSSGTLGNAVSFLTEQTIRRMVNTADIVRIDSADQPGSEGPTGRAAATPLVRMIDGRNCTLPQNRIERMRVFRPQAGKAAIIMDPQPGDKALAVFAKHDSTNVRTGENTEVHPGSFRNFDQADGFLLNGFQGETPEIWLKLDPVSGDISLSTKSANIDISCRESGDITVKTGSGNVTIQAGNDASGTITLDGKVVVTRTLEVLNRHGEKASAFTGGFCNEGGTVTSNGVVLETHTHPGIVRGTADTDSPNKGA